MMQGLNIMHGKHQDGEDFETAPLAGSKSGAASGGGATSLQRVVERARQRHLRLGWSNVAIGLLLLLSLGLSVALFRCGSESAEGGGGMASGIGGLAGGSTSHRHKEDDAGLIATFLVVGDWGRHGKHNQSVVAAAMAAAADSLHPQFIISTGDNFYPHGLNGTGDPGFDESFRLVYGAPSLQVPWYAVLGNHDYGDGSSDDAAECLARGSSFSSSSSGGLGGSGGGGGSSSSGGSGGGGGSGGKQGSCTRGPLSQLDAELARRDARWRCARLYSLSLGEPGEADLFFMDTSPLVEEYWTEPWAEYPDGIAQQSWESQLRELEAMLARSTARWKLLIAHHPVRSNGEHGDTQEMRARVEPLLRRYGVRAAFHGHDHDLEHVHAPGQMTHYFVTGAGSETRPLEGARDSQGAFATPGFAAVELRRDELSVRFVGIAPGSGDPSDDDGYNYDYAGGGGGVDEVDDDEYGGGSGGKGGSGGAGGAGAGGGGQVGVQQAGVVLYEARLPRELDETSGW